MAWDHATKPERMWKIADGLAKGRADATQSPEGRSILIQDEPWVRIVVAPLGDPSKRQVTKIYRTAPYLVWRDLFRTPQAQREFQNLDYAGQKSLPVAQGLAWGVSRRPGKPWYSQLSTVFLEGSTLRDLLGRAETKQDSKAKLIGETGRLIAKFHRNGLIWGSAHTGNIMVASTRDSALVAFDFPYALCTGKNMSTSRLARYDLWSMARDCRKLCRLENSLIDLLFSEYARELGFCADRLREQVDPESGRGSTFWDRVRLRALHSFRIRSF